MLLPEMWLFIHEYVYELEFTKQDENYFSKNPGRKIPIELTMEKDSSKTFLREKLSQKSYSSLATNSTEELIDELLFDHCCNAQLDIKYLLKKCEKYHEGKKIVFCTFPIRVRDVFVLLFTNSRFFTNFHIKRKTTNFISDEWSYYESKSADEALRRTLTFDIALKPNVGPKVAHVTENQVILNNSFPGRNYAINVESYNSGVPFADAFYIHIHYCLHSENEDSSTMTVYASIKYKKTLWTMIKGFIEKNTWAGMKEYFADLVEAINEECANCPSVICPEVKPTISVTSEIASKTVLLMATSQVHDMPHALPDVSAEIEQFSSESFEETRRYIPSFVNFTVFVLIILIGFNALLCHTLWQLEQKIQNYDADLSSAERSRPIGEKSMQELLKLIQKQESLHNVETNYWRQILQVAVNLLQQTEDSLHEVHNTINISKPYDKAEARKK